LPAREIGCWTKPSISYAAFKLRAKHPTSRLGGIARKFMEGRDRQRLIRHEVEQPSSATVCIDHGSFMTCHAVQGYGS